jgi:hypothetical protein
MPHDVGPNAGISGLVAVTVTLATGQKFVIEARKWAEQLGGNALRIDGRGTNRWGVWRLTRPGGTVAITGSSVFDRPPLPDAWRGQTGTLTIQHGTWLDGSTEKTAVRTVPVQITAATTGRDAKTQNAWDVVITATVTGEPAYANWPSAAPTADTPAAATVQRYEGLSKTLDPQALADAAQQQFVVWPVTDTDAAELAVIATINAANPASPVTGGKLRAATFTRVDGEVGIVTRLFGLTDTAEDITNPRNITTVDPNHLASQATAALINATPGTPAGDSFVLRTTETMELNDGKMLTSCTFGMRTTIQDVEFPNNVVWLDPDQQDSGGQLCDVSATPVQPALPSGVVVVAYSEEQQTNSGIKTGKWKVGVETSGQKLAREAGKEYIDADGWESTATIGAFDATPADHATLATIGTETRLLANGHYLEVKRAEVEGPKAKWVREHTRTTDDPDGLTSSGSVGKLGSVGTAPAGQKIIATTTQATPDGTIGYVSETGLETSGEKLVREATKNRIDVDLLESEATTAGLDVAPPNYPGLTQVAERLLPQPDGHALNIAEYAVETPLQKIVRTATFKRIDPNGIESASANASATADPGVLGGLQSVGLEERTLANGSTLFIHHGDALSSAQKLAYPLTREYVDPSGLESFKMVGSLGSDPGADAGYADRGYEVRPTAGGLLYERKGGVTTTAEDVTLPGSPYSFNPSEGPEKTVTTITSSTSDAATIAAGLLADTAPGNLRSDPLFNGLKVVKRTPGKAIVAKLFANDDLLERRSGPRSYLDHVRATAAIGSADATIHVADTGYMVVGGAATIYRFVIDYQIVERSQERFVLRRRVICTPAQCQELALLSMRGQVNNAAFYEYPQGTLKFMGRELVYEGQTAEGHLAVMDFAFLYDSLGHPNENKIPFGQVTAAYGKGVSGAGFFTASAVVRTGCVMEWPTQGDFSIFTGTLPVVTP